MEREICEREVKGLITVFIAHSSSQLVARHVLVSQSASQSVARLASPVSSHCYLVSLSWE